MPATSANLGPGFDCLGVALGLHNRFVFSEAAAFSCTVTSEVDSDDAAQVATSENNLAYRAFLHLFSHLNQLPPTVQLTVEMGVPLGRGLGSSATAIVGGVAAANAWLGFPLAVHEWLTLAARLEGHPDNVVPAALGGFQLSLLESGLLTCPLAWHPEIALVLAVPDFTLSTSKARSVLPRTVPYADAVFNAAHVGLLVQAIACGNGDWLKEALVDRLHQPYRTALIPGWEQVHTAAITARAWGLVVSGAGPSLLALAPQAQSAEVQQAMAAVWPTARIYSPTLDRDGCQIIVEA